MEEDRRLCLSFTIDSKITWYQITDLVLRIPFVIVGTLDFILLFRKFGKFEVIQSPQDLQYKAFEAFGSDSLDGLTQVEMNHLPPNPKMPISFLQYRSSIPPLFEWSLPSYSCSVSLAMNHFLQPPQQLSKKDHTSAPVHQTPPILTLACSSLILSEYLRQS